MRILISGGRVVTAAGDIARAGFGERLARNHDDLERSAPGGRAAEGREVRLAVPEVARYPYTAWRAGAP